MENELAIIAIKGGRYPEAENIFNTEIQTKPSSHSYFGLGVCKLNMLLNVNRTVDEVIYCFEKSVFLSSTVQNSNLPCDLLPVQYSIYCTGHYWPQ